MNPATATDPRAMSAADSDPGVPEVPAVPALAPPVAQSSQPSSSWSVQAPAASALPFPVPLEPGPAWPRTIGVAIPIPEPFLAELGAYRERFGDPLAHAIVAHITLVPPTQVPDDEAMAAVVAHLAASSAQFQPFRVVLLGAGTFQPVSPVVFVPLDQGEQEVRAIEAAVRKGPLDRTLNFPYHPHVTVAHDVDPAWLAEAEQAMAGYRAEFEVAALALFENGPDGVWREIQQFALAGPNTPAGGSGEPGASESS